MLSINPRQKSNNSNFTLIWISIISVRWTLRAEEEEMKKNVIKLGMPTLAEYNTLEENINLQKSLNLDFIEINMCFPQFSSSELKRIDLKSISKKRNIDFTIHLPEEIDLGMFNEELREGSINLIKNILTQYDRETIRIINMHINEGTYITLPDRKMYVYQEYNEKYITNFINSLEQIVRLLEEKGILLCFENTGNFGRNKIQSMVKTILQYQNIGLTWDFGHDASSGYNESNFMISIKDCIKHTHLHDFNNRDHQELYTGSIDIREKIDFIKKHSLDTVIETKNSKTLINSVNRLRIEENI